MAWGTLPVLPRANFSEVSSRRGGQSLGYLTIVWSFGLGWTAALYALLFSSLGVVTGADLSHKIIPNVIKEQGEIYRTAEVVAINPPPIISSLSVRP